MKSLFIEFYKNKRLILQLSRKDMKDKYLGSYLGIIWAFLQPIVTIMIFWFLFQVGFRSVPIENYPYVLWLVSGMIPWFFFTDALMNASNSILDFRFLVKNVVFRLELIPIIKIISSLFIHLFFILFIIAMFFVYGFNPTLYTLQIFYYLFATIILLIGFTWITSSLIIFLKDIGQMLALILQLGFWITPIFWSLNIIPVKYSFFIKLNPLYYIIQGYRDSLVFHQWFWQYPMLTLYFWMCTLIVLFLGAFIFKRTRPHFADVI